MGGRTLTGVRLPLLAGVPDGESTIPIRHKKDGIIVAPLSAPLCRHFAVAAVWVDSG